MKTTTYTEELGKVSIEAIASIAASLSATGLNPSVATSQAFELLELAAAGRAGVRVDGGWEGSLARIEAGKAAYAERMAADYGKDVSEGRRGKDGKLLPVQFDDALKSVLETQNPNMKPVNHMPEFKAWLMDAEGLESLQAGERIATFRQDGIPATIYHHFRLEYENWRREKTRKGRSASGAKGQEKKKELVSLPSKKKKTRQRAS